MPEPASNKKKPIDSMEAFRSVDRLVSKPILGSDGAASWQAFRKDNAEIFTNKPSNAPLAPLKKADKLGSGMSSWQEERAREQSARKETGAAAVGDGYTNFKKKNGQEEALAKKHRKQVEQRIRPEDMEYFLFAKTFEGWKWDYVFTTKDGKTGYYWDGSDSLKRLNGELPPDAGTNVEVAGEGANDDTTSSGIKRETADTAAATNNSSSSNNNNTKQKKKKRKLQAPVIVEDPNNPMEQVQAAIRKRNERLGLGSGGAAELDLPEGWETATDPSSSKIYYFHRATGNRQWDKPKNDNSLPNGWKVAKDASGKEYYYHASGETRWEKPTVE